MKKIIFMVLGLLLLTGIIIALAGMYKFNYLANQPDYDVDGNKIKTVEQAILSGDYVGMSVTQAQDRAQADGVPFRVTMADGEAFAVTMDYRPGRINAVVENGIVVSYTVEGAEEEATASYDQNSWKALISADCQSFFDGCNNCQKIEGEAEVACTKKFCQEYNIPQCLDAEV